MYMPKNIIKEGCPQMENVLTLSYKEKHMHHVHMPCGIQNFSSMNDVFTESIKY
jgi:hypothetical protein